jgi:hypothetical protein
MKKGQLYKIKFLDHCKGHDELLTCEVVGWIINARGNKIFISPWRVVENDKETIEHNVDPYAIAKKLIVSSQRLI